MRAEAAVLLSQLQATHATLQAALVQVGAQILALKTAIEREDEEDTDDGVRPRCPACGRTNALPAGCNEKGETEYVCECGGNFVASPRRES